MNTPDLPGMVRTSLATGSDGGQLRNTSTRHRSAPTSGSVTRDHVGHSAPWRTGRGWVQLAYQMGTYAQTVRALEPSHLATGDVCHCLIWTTTRVPCVTVLVNGLCAAHTDGHATRGRRGLARL